MASSSTSPRRPQLAKFLAIICFVVISPAQSFSCYFPGVGEAVLRKSGQSEHVHVSRHRGRRCSYYIQGKSSGAVRLPRESILKATSCSRTELLKAAGWVLVATSGLSLSQAVEVLAPEDTFIDFVDSRRLFSCQIPSNFLRKERAKDKSGTLFVAGDYNKAEIMSVQLLTTYDLLTDAGLPTIGDLTKWESLGKPRLVAELLKQRRDADAAGGAPVESVVLPGVSVDGDVLKFTLKSPIKVMRMDLLEKDRGVSELYRNTLVKAVMRGDGSFLVVWAGALNTDWDQKGGARDRLRKVVESFRLEGMVVDGVRLGAV